MARKRGGSKKVVTTTGHTRGPRGPDKGKPRVRVRGYRRRKPSK